MERSRVIGFDYVLIVLAHGCRTEVKRRGVHGFRGTAAGEFVSLKQALGFSEIEARRELAMWLGHNPQRTEVTYAYVPHDP